MASRFADVHGRHRVWVSLVWLVSLLAVAGVAWVAGRAAFAPPLVPADSLTPATYVVAEASIGASLPVAVQVTWQTHPLAAGSLSGMVTAINLPESGVIQVGDVLLSVDLEPVVVAQGSVPAFRDLSLGARGDDVRQLQAFLNASRYLNVEPDGRFGTSTVSAVRAWQKACGVEPTGVVLAGSILFVASLPARIVFDDTVTVGSVISPGQQIISVVDEPPLFQATVGGNVSSSVIPKVGQQVNVLAPDGSQTWEAAVTSVQPDISGGSTAVLQGTQGDPVCGDQCDLLVYSASGLMVNGTLVVSPTVTGPAVPLAAMGTAPDGSRFIICEDGTRRAVTVRGGDASMMIVEGVDVGEVVRLFAE